MALVRLRERPSDLGEWRLRQQPYPRPGGHLLDGILHTLDQLDIAFDDTHAIANAGLLLPATLAERLGIEQAADAVIDLGGRAGAHRPGRKLLTLAHTMIAGGDCIDDADLRRCGRTPACWATGSWRPLPWGPSCACSASGTSPA
jgi:hypothetical protein